MRRIWLIFSQAVTVSVAALFVVSTFRPDWLALSNASNPTGLSGGAVPVLVAQAAASSPLQALSAAAKRASPAVVSVTASKSVRADPHAEDPVFRFFFGDRGRAPARQRPQVGLGSGVIVSQDGYLLTNNHVIQGADDITIQLADGREAKAKLVGTDPESDVAVLKIELEDLPVVVLGRLEDVHVGDAVLAIGNPFNVGQTVTSGIVSALGRSGLGLSTFENFIQTDAAINPGNSGGALIDVNGNLVGINTAIYSRSGGSMGIGFAIPVDLARQVMEGLVREGEVTRGWIGVQPRDIDAEFARNFKLPASDGVLIVGVLQDGPASLGGVRPGDIVTQIQGKPVHNTAQLMNRVAELKPQTEAVLSVMRNEQSLELKVLVARRPRNQNPQE